MTPILLAYGTYGAPAMTPAEAIRAAADVGYEAIELTVAPSHRDAAPPLPAETARSIRAALAATGLPLIAVMGRLHVLGSDEDHAANLALMASLVASAEAAGALSPPVIAFTMGGRADEWPLRRAELVDKLGALGRVSSRLGAVLAVEPHVGGLIDSPDRALDLLSACDPAAIRLNYDISHFALPGMACNIEDITARLLAHAAHVHIKDSVPTADGFRFVLPGEGPLDLVRWFGALASHGWRKPVTVEVSAMVWQAPGYDALAAMRSSFSALDRARRQALAVPTVEKSP